MKDKIFVKVEEGAKIFAKQTVGSAGYDIYSFCTQDVTIPPNEQRVIKTGISLEMPINFECQIRPRSGLTIKNIHVRFGTIDSDYRGDVGVIMKNESNTDFVVTNHMRIAQIVFSQIPEINLSIAENLTDSQRGVGGFGSTGV